MKLRQAGPVGVGHGAVTGASMPALDPAHQCPASPQVLPAKACRLDRPTDHAGTEIIAWVKGYQLKSTSKSTWQFANGTDNSG